MAGFTLIHGSTQNSSGWDRVAARLRAKDHEVVAPDLPKKQPAWGLTEYADFIAQYSARTRPRVMVAHSFSGVFLPLLANHADILIFEAAVIPQPGLSVRDQYERRPTMFPPDWIAVGKRWYESSEHEALAREYLFHDCDEESVRWALTTLELFDTRHLGTEPTPLRSWPPVRCVAIVCRDDRTLTPAWQRGMAEEIQAEVIELRAGHCPHVSQPDLIANALHELIHPARSS